MYRFCFDKNPYTLYNNIIMENVAEENININGEELKKQENKKQLEKAFYIIANAVLFAAICVYAAQPMLILFSKLFFRGKYGMYSLFYYSSVLSVIGIGLKILARLLFKFDKNNIKKNAINAAKGKWELLVLFLAFLWTFVSCLVAKKQTIVWEGNDYNIEGFYSICMYGAIFFASYLLDSEKFKRAFCIVLVTSAAVMGTILLYVNLSGESFIFHPTRSVYRNSNHYGYALSISCLLSAGLFLNERKIWVKILFSVAFGILHANMLVSDCFGSFVGEIVGLICLFVFKALSSKNKKVLIEILVILIIAVVVTCVLESYAITSMMEEFGKILNETGDILNGDSTGREGSGRWELWVKTVDVINKVPLYGKGLDCYYGNNFVDSSLDMPHNEYIQIASNTGVPTLIFYLVALGGVFVRAFLRRKELTQTAFICLIASISYCISAFFGNTFTYTYPFLLIVLGLGMFKSTKGKENGN